MSSLAVLIAARNEEFLNRTVEDVLGHSSEATSIIVVLDGAWPMQPLTPHPRVQVVKLAESVGQRAAVNLAARLASADYVMKLDAHCSVAPDFDVALMAAAEELGPDVTQIPSQWNLHVFDWVCEACGKRRDQGPTPSECLACHATTLRKEIVWAKRRLTEAWRFDQALKFGYFGDWKDRPAQQGKDIIDTMSCLGACWFQSREMFWRLGGLDEATGSWGQVGTELACKAWLSGGRLVTNRRTFYSHMFRTQGADFGFPYPITNQQQERAREYSRDLWLNNRWPLQVHPLSWLVERFWPVPGWSDSDLANLRAKDAAFHALRTSVSLAPNALALDADALAVAPRDNSGVPATARISALTPGIFPVSDKVEMLGVGAVSTPTQVVNLDIVIDRDRADEPRVCEPMHSELASEQKEPTVAGVIEFASPQPATSALVDLDLSEEAPQLKAREVGDREKLLISHASGTSDVGSGAPSCLQRDDAPSILSKSHTRGIVYYSDNRLDPVIAEAARRTIEASGMPIVAVTLVPIRWPAARNIVLDAERGYLTMFRQILAGLEAIETDLVFFCEHDVLYPIEHFREAPDPHDRILYNQNVWKVDARSGMALHYRASQTSGLQARADTLLAHYRRRVDVVAAQGFSRAIGFEPGTHTRKERIDDLAHSTWFSSVPLVDIRHDKNLTPSRWKREQFRNQRYTEGWTESDRVPGWGVTHGRMREFLSEICGVEAVA